MSILMHKIRALLCLTLRLRQDSRHFCRRHIRKQFHEWKLLNFKWNFIEICSLGSNWQQTTIGTENGLSPNRRQAIIWSNYGLVYWRCYPTLGCDIQGFRAMGLSVQYWPRWFQDFPAIWLAVPFGENGAHLGICTLPGKIVFVCEISCFWLK